MVTSDHTAAAWSPEDLIGGWQHETTIMEFRRDGSYRIVIAEACREEIVSCGKYVVEQAELKLDPVIENEADLPSKATYKAVYRVHLRNPDQLDLQVSPDADDQNAKRKALLDGRKFQCIAGDDSLVLTVRETSGKIRQHLDCLAPTAHKRLGRARAWVKRVNGQGDPVRIKNLEKVLAHLQVLQHFLESGRPSCAQTRATLSCLLTQLDSWEYRA